MNHMARADLDAILNRFQNSLEWHTTRRAWLSFFTLPKSVVAKIFTLEDWHSMASRSIATMHLAIADSCCEKKKKCNFDFKILLGS